MLQGSQGQRSKEGEANAERQRTTSNSPQSRQTRLKPYTVGPRKHSSSSDGTSPTPGADPSSWSKSSSSLLGVKTSAAPVERPGALTHHPTYSAPTDWGSSSYSFSYPRQPSPRPST